MFHSIYLIHVLQVYVSYMSSIYCKLIKLLVARSGSAADVNYPMAALMTAVAEVIEKAQAPSAPVTPTAPYPTEWNQPPPPTPLYPPLNGDFRPQSPWYPLPPPPQNMEFSHPAGWYQPQSPPEVGFSSPAWYQSPQDMDNPNLSSWYPPSPPLPYQKQEQLYTCVPPKD